MDPRIPLKSQENTNEYNSIETDLEVNLALDELTKDEVFEFLNGKFLQANKLFYSQNSEKACVKFREIVEIIEDSITHIDLPTKLKDEIHFNIKLPSLTRIAVCLIECKEEQIAEKYIEMVIKNEKIDIESESYLLKLREYIVINKEKTIDLRTAMNDNQLETLNSGFKSTNRTKLTPVSNFSINDNYEEDEEDEQNGIKSICQKIFEFVMCPFMIPKKIIVYLIEKCIMEEPKLIDYQNESASAC